jgi:hypothetical protein
VKDYALIIRRVLSSSRVKLYAYARRDVERGIVDVRILRMLYNLAKAGFVMRVGPLRERHAKYVAGTKRISNHWWGRGVDIVYVGRAGRHPMAPVSRANPAALEMLREIAARAEAYGLSELGGPWAIRYRNRKAKDGTTSFTKDHGDHAHATVGSRRLEESAVSPVSPKRYR